MPKLTVFVSALLILLGIGTWITSAQNSLTALIPSFFGVALCFTGLAAFNDNWRKHAIHAAAMISLVGTVGAMSRALPSISDSPLRLATISQVVMSVVLISYLVFCIRSFIAVRRSNGAEN